MRKEQNSAPPRSDADTRAILVQAMADVGADPAFIHAFQKTGIYVCEENQKILPKESLRTFDDAAEEYLADAERPPQSTPQTQDKRCP